MISQTQASNGRKSDAERIVAFQIRRWLSSEGPAAQRGDYSPLSANQIGRHCVQLILRPAVLNPDILALRIARFFQPLAKRGDDVCVWTGRCGMEKPDYQQFWLLRTSGERPGCRPAEQCDELAPPQKIEMQKISAQRRGKSDDHYRFV